jgi:2-polyprenyl-6-methoxyphenol hydroxylase-like FAD-dependent oxidoreductase
MRSIDERILLMGDAAHPMSPFKSQGANQALLDAMSLSDCLSFSSDLSVLSAKYNSEMQSRTTGKVQQSRERVVRYHTPEYLSSANYIYPRIDVKLMSLLEERGIGATSGEAIEESIKAIMKEHNYIK